MTTVTNDAPAKLAALEARCAALEEELKLAVGYGQLSALALCKLEAQNGTQKESIQILESENKKLRERLANGEKLVEEFHKEVLRYAES